MFTEHHTRHRDCDELMRVYVGRKDVCDAGLDVMNIYY